MYFRSFGRTNFSMFAIHAKIFRIENNDWVTFRKYLSYCCHCREGKKNKGTSPECSKQKATTVLSHKGK
ncbi:hypothetical protein PFUGPA_01527 [Plasmodium falciparum Palo Alto/Uganda]|uniref:Uncharacterized protein n=1 Tax=Plasmodium falciparum (isolate Palo Alto / Uganda) TaxID=57270 RepID=W4J558_PLAFP|nr:hypothetical protein PFUGPA_01527 [Plasmodium falciparum Palo Alto/Uganda]